MADRTLADRFWTKVDRTAAGGCWEWTGKLDNGGYGEFRYTQNSRRFYRRAHRVAFQLAVGPIPEGLVLDHLCRNRACVNPDHLEPVTIGENIRRGEVGKATTAPPICRNGHPYEDGSFRLRKGQWRTCLECERARKLRFAQRSKS